MTMADDYCPEVVGTLRKAQKSCERMASILGWEGTFPRVLGVLFKAVVQAVLLFGSETWVLTPRMGRALRSFHHRVTRRITGRPPNQWEDGIWEYPPLEIEMEE